MRFQRVLFVIPNLKWSFGYPQHPHPGIGYLSSLLEEHGVKCDVLDMTLGHKLSALKRKIEKFEPHLVGVTLYSYHYRHGYQFIREIKKITDKPIIIGGPHVSLLGRKVLEQSSAAFAIKHEGEYPLLELCLGKPFEDISNLIYRKNGEVILGYLDFICLVINSRFVITDSGGIQAETTILNVPCLTLKDIPEWTITLTEGSNVLVGDGGQGLAAEAGKILAGEGKRATRPELWDGKTAERIVEVLARCKVA